MAESTALTFSASDGKYVAEFTVEAECTAVQVMRSDRGLLQVFVGLGGSDLVSVKAWSKHTIPACKVFDVQAPVGATVRIVSGSEVTEAYTMPYDA